MTHDLTRRYGLGTFCEASQGSESPAAETTGSQQIPDRRQLAAARPPAFLGEPRSTVTEMRTPFRQGPRQPEITLRLGRDVALATFKERAAARGTDLILAGLVLVLATVLMGCLAYGRLITGDEREPYGWLLTPLVVVFAALFLTAAYETWAKSATGQTRGKRLQGIEVVRLRDGRKPGVAAAFVRAALPLSVSVCGLVLIWGANPPIVTLVAIALYCLTYLSAIWDRCGRAWHDRLSQTLVTSRVPIDHRLSQ